MQGRAIKSKQVTVPGTLMNVKLGAQRPLIPAKAETQGYQTQPLAACPQSQLSIRRQVS